jgi:hypothetical protein
MKGESILPMWIQIWSFIDKFYFSCSRLEYVNKEKKNIFRVRLLTYRGQNIVLSDGTRISENDFILKIHLHNCLLLTEMKDMKHDVKRAFYVYDRVRTSLPDLADFIFRHERSGQIKGILGITILSRGVNRLGFEVQDIPNLYYRKYKQLYMKPMFILCHPNRERSWKQENMVPKFLLMSKEQLFQHYLQKT